MSEPYADVEGAWEEIFEAVDEKGLGLSEADVSGEIQAGRQTVRHRPGLIT